MIFASITARSILEQSSIVRCTNYFLCFIVARSHITPALATSTMLARHKHMTASVASSIAMARPVQWADNGGAVSRYDNYALSQSLDTQTHYTLYTLQSRYYVTRTIRTAHSGTCTPRSIVIVQNTGVQLQYGNGMHAALHVHIAGATLLQAIGPRPVQCTLYVANNSRQGCSPERGGTNATHTPTTTTLCTCTHQYTLDRHMHAHNHTLVHVCRYCRKRLSTTSLT